MTRRPRTTGGFEDESIGKRAERLADAALAAFRKSHLTREPGHMRAFYVAGYLRALRDVEDDDEGGT